MLQGYENASINSLSNHCYIVYKKYLSKHIFT